MKGNPVRAAVNRGEVQYGTWVNFARNPAILPILKGAGLDFIRLDMEHSAPSMETVADMALLGRALDFPVVPKPTESGSHACWTPASGTSTVPRSTPPSTPPKS